MATPDKVAISRKIQLKVQNNGLDLEGYLDRKRADEGIKLSPGAAINQYSVDGIEKKFMNEGILSKFMHFFSKHIWKRFLKLFLKKF